jgi:hypothetical protein
VLAQGTGDAKGFNRFGRRKVHFLPQKVLFYRKGRNGRKGINQVNSP